MNRTTLSTLLVLALAATALTAPIQGKSVESIVASRLPAMGHRNWIVVADSAYPLQTSPGIETITVTESQLSSVMKVLNVLSKTKHVRPIVHVDAELAFVPESSAPGVGKYRTQLDEILKGRKVERTLHNDIIKKLDAAGKSFKVLLIKTPLTIPYTSVFFELDCGYWSADSEKELRKAMGKG